VGVVCLAEYVNIKSLAKKQILDRNPGKLEVKVKMQNEWKHGVGAVLTTNINTTKTKNRDGSVTIKVIQTSTINIKKNMFGTEFAKLYGTDQLRRRNNAQFWLDAANTTLAIVPTPVSLAAKAAKVAKTTTDMTTRVVAWIYIGHTKYLPKAMLLVKGFLGSRTDYSIAYQAGGRIEEKLVISTTSKDGHGIERIKRTYTTWSSTGKNCCCLENKENIF
jgi:hypothetical protein